MAEPKRKETDRGPAATASPAQKPHWLDRRIDLTAVDPAIWIFLAILVLAAVLRFSHLGARAMHHDEAIHAWYSWRFYTGEELYRYNPMFHGPFLYHLTTLFYLLFGVSDPIARAPEALFGLLLVASCFFMRRYLGRWGWLIAAGLLALSPAFVYFSRFARHDALMVLFTLGMAIFFFRHLEERRPRDLVLAAALLALSFTTMEATFITAFIFLSFLGLAYLLDFQKGRFRAEARIIAGVVFGISLMLEASLARRGGMPAAQVALMALLLLPLGYLLLSFAWPKLFARGVSPVQQAVRGLVENPRPFLTALGVFGVIFGLLFTTFLTNPRGFVDGLVGGLRYWPAQQNVGRGGQPWFYYLLLLTVYEPIILSAGVAGFILVLTRVLRGEGKGRTHPEPENAPSISPHLPFPLFLAYWALLSLLLYSWAGERMPWLLLHVALPLVLLAALALDRFLAWINWRSLWRSWDWVVGPLFLLLFFALRGLANGITRLRPQQSAELTDQYLLLQVAVLGVILLGLIALLAWRIYRIEPRHLGQSIAAVGLLVLGAYTIRSTFLANYYHGDTPVEMLVYTQTSPDVPLVVRQIERLAVDQTRKVRTYQDPTGGHGLKVAIDNSRDVGLDQPFNWYLRDFSRAGTLSYFDGTRSVPPDADILMVLAENEPVQRPYLQSDYTAMRLKLRWWFPEFETYQRWRLVAVGVTPEGYGTMPWLRSRTYQPDGWIHLWNYLTLRRLPYTLQSQDFYLYIRNSLLPATGPGEVDLYLEKLAQRPATGFLGSPGSGPGQLSYPRGIALDAEGNLYVADSGNHRVVRFDPQGQASEWGSFCALETKEGCQNLEGGGALPLGAGQFNEPWGIAADSAGRVYVADTWNHRVQVFDSSGTFLGQWGSGRLVDVGEDMGLRESNPYGFYGPRGIAVDKKGNVYVTDTGNERVLVYKVSFDAAGNASAEFWYQWGSTGPEPGQFLEPVGIAVDEAGRVYVADTWNLRLQVFAPGTDGKVSPQPAATVHASGWESDSRENKPYVAVDPGGRIYFTVPERNYVAAVSLTGEVLTVWGGYGSDLSTFVLPVGLAVDAGGKVYVGDSGNGRVLIFEMP